MKPGRTGRGSGGGADYEHEYDLLTAALIGVTLGAGLTYLLSRGSGRRTVSPVMTRAVREARRAGQQAAKLGRRGARWAADRGEELWEAIPTEQIRDQVEDHLGKARKTIDSMVDRELRDLRRAIRRQRKKIGV